MATTVKPRKPRAPKPEKPKLSGKKPAGAPVTWGKGNPPEDEAAEDDDEGDSEVEDDDADDEDTGPSQKPLPGMENKSFPDLEKAIKQCHKLGLARKLAQDEENKAKDKVNILLHQHRNEIPKTDEDLVYKCDGIVARLSVNEKLTVRKAENDSHQD